MKSISITRALTELKVLDKRIETAIYSAEFITAHKLSIKKLNGITTVDDFNKAALASYDSITDLIKRRDTIKAKIVASNSIETVELPDGNKYTVAAAIERKNSIKYEKSLLTAMKSQLSKTTSTVNKNNEKAEEKADELVKSSLAGSDKSKIDDNCIKAITEPYMANNKWEALDPLKLTEKIKALEDKILIFESNIDFLLSESNSITKIEIED